MDDLDGTLREWEAEEHRLLELMARFDEEAESMPTSVRLDGAARLETVRREWRASKERVASLLAASGA